MIPVIPLLLRKVHILRLYKNMQVHIVGKCTYVIVCASLLAFLPLLQLSIDLYLALGFDDFFGRGVSACRTFTSRYMFPLL